MVEIDKGAENILNIMNRRASGAGQQHTVPAVFFCILLAAISGCSDGTAPPPAADMIRPVKTLVVSNPSATSGIELPGQLRAAQRTDLAFEEVGGHIVELPVTGREGQEIMKGELLAQIDPTDFEAALHSAEGDLGDAHSVLDLAQTESERMEKMQVINPDLVSTSMIERTREKLKRAQDRVKTLETKVREAENLLEYSSLRAPFSGIVTRVLVEHLQKVEPSEPVVSLQDITRLEVLIEAPETLMAAAQSLGPSSISAIARFPTAPGKEYSLTLKEAARIPDPATQTYPIVLEMPIPKDIDLTPGMTGTVTVSGKGPAIGKARVLIPAIAVMTDPDGKDYVWLVNAAELRVHRRDVQMGRLAASDQIQILDGLAGGERIVVAGVRQLAENRQVRLWEDQEASQTQ
jgi:RND family efflux transporter MFP subunit